MKLSMKHITETHFLDSDTETDPDKRASVTVRQLRTGEYRQRAELTAKQSYSDDNGLTIRFNGPEQRRMDARLALAGTTNIFTEEDQPWFKFREGKNGSVLDMPIDAFNGAWDALPTAVSNEIYEIILRVNPLLSPAGSDEAGE